MKKFVCMVLAACVFACAGCSKSSVDDAAAIDASREAAADNTDEKVTNATDSGYEPPVWVNGKSTTIKVASEGEKVTGGGYELTVEESWEGDDTLTLLDKLTGDETFKNNLINVPSSDYDSSGRYTGRESDSKHIFAKIKIKCLYIENERRGDNKVIFSPHLFCKTSDTTYSFITGTEGVGYDKYSNFANAGKDMTAYTFKEGEEIETWIVMRYSGAFAPNSSIYMFSGFVNISVLGDGYNDVKDGSYMIKLDLKS